MYADDTAVSVKGDNFASLLDMIKSLLYILLEWCNANKITINKTKTKYLVFTNCQYRSPHLVFEGTKIEEIEKICYLGIIFDNRLKYTTHIDIINKNLAKLCGITYRLKSKFDLTSAKLFYYSFVYSLLSYGIATWGGILMVYLCPETHRLYKRILRNLF